MRRALITGITGQDGTFLAEWLLKKDYEVFGFCRKETWPGSHPVRALSSIQPLFGSLTNPEDLHMALHDARPDEIYNLASQSSPRESWIHPTTNLVINGLGATYLFEAVRTFCPNARVYHASSSEMFGRTICAPQDERTPFSPANPYAASKVYAHQMAQLYRDSYGLFIANGILFNHESERRPLHFVTQKVAHGAACAALGLLHSPALNEKGEPIVYKGKLALGNLDIARDWGYAGDFVRAMWLILQQDIPQDFVIGTGELHTLRELCDTAYRSVNKNWQDYITSDPAFSRPLEPNQTVANASKARRILGWHPQIGFHKMIKKMVEAQIVQLQSSLNHQH